MLIQIVKTDAGKKHEPSYGVLGIASEEDDHVFYNFRIRRLLLILSGGRSVLVWLWSGQQCTCPRRSGERWELSETHRFFGRLVRRGEERELSAAGHINPREISVLVVVEIER